MNILTRMDVDIYSLIISMLILFNEFHGVERTILQDKLFKSILHFNIILITLDIIGFLSNLQLGALNNFVSTLVTTVNYIFIPAPLILWCIYANFQVYQNKNRIKNLVFPLSIPFLINALTLLISSKTGIIFYYDSKNIYHRGPLFMVLALTCYIYVIYPLIFIVKNKKKLARDKFLPMLMFPVPVLIGGILQNIFFGISTVWAGSTLSILILFFSIQSSRLSTDYLTGLYNRRQLDSFLNGKISNSSVNNLFAGIMIDLDKFKQINDIYGHQTGDDALVTLSKLLKKCFTKNDFIARYAGDEFVIVIDIKRPKQLELSIERLENMLKSYNSKNSKPYKINLSMGYAVYDHISGMNSDQFIKQLDTLLYREKINKSYL